MLTTAVVYLTVSFTICLASEAPIEPQGLAAVMTKLFNLTSVDRTDWPDFGNASCFTWDEYEHLFGGMLKHSPAKLFSDNLFRQALNLMAREEMRKTLNLPPSPLRVNVSYDKPSEAELASASTADAYFELRTQDRELFTLESGFYVQESFRRAIALLDQRLPAARAYLRRRFEQVRDDAAPGDTFREQIDRMLAQVDNNVRIALVTIYDYECI